MKTICDVENKWKVNCYVE